MCPAAEIRGYRCVMCVCSMSHFRCTDCLHSNLKVLETRSYENVIYRIRECTNCKERFLTEETIKEKKRYWM